MRQNSVLDFTGATPMIADLEQVSRAEHPRPLSGVGAGLAPARRGEAELPSKRLDPGRSEYSVSPRKRNTATLAREGASPSPTPETEILSLRVDCQPQGCAETDRQPSGLAEHPRPLSGVGAGLAPARRGEAELPLSRQLRCTIVSIALTTLLSPVPLLAQPSSDVANAEVASAEVSEVVEVQLVEIDVRATTADGAPMPDLTREDFRLFVDGREVAIDFFTPPRREDGGESSMLGTARLDGAQTNSAQTSGDSEVNVVVYADLGLLEPGDLTELSPRLGDFFAGQLPVDARTMLVVAGARLRVASPMGGDRAGLREELEAIDGSEAGGQLALAYRSLLRDLRRARASIEQEIRFNDPLLRQQRRDSDEGVDNPGVINSPDAETVNADGFLAPQRLARDVQRSLGNDLRRQFDRIQAFHQAADQHLLQTAERLRLLIRMVAGLPGSTHIVYLGRRLPTAAPAMLFRAWQEETVGLLRDTRSLASDDFEQRQAALDGLEIEEADITPFRDGGRLIARAALDAAAVGVTLHTRSGCGRAPRSTSSACWPRAIGARCATGRARATSSRRS